MKLHLVDGTFELFRAYYSRPALRAPDGRPVNAVAGLLDSMFSLLREPDVTHVGVATDHVIASFRNDLYPGYKTDAGVPADLLAQFTLAERALEAMGLTVWAMVEDEADDALATAASRWADDPRVEQVVICSVDKDLAQCVRDGRVVLRDRMRKRTYDEEGVRAKFGVPPTLIPDYLALVGDSSDGYPGLPGYGSQSAAAVLNRFGGIDDIPDDPGGWGIARSPALAATIAQRRSEAILYRELARLRLDSEITGSLDDLEWRGVPRTEWLALCDELGFTGLRSRPHRWADDGAASLTTSTAVDPIRRAIRVECSVEHAFETFTDRIGDWWPLETHSIGEADAETAILEPWEGGRLYERMRSGGEAHWARVVTWEPPHRLVLEWKVNPASPAATEIEVRFTADGGGTRVELEHRGWERLGDLAADARASYDSDWPMVLGLFADATTR